MPDYDQDSFDTTRQAVLTLAAGVKSADSMFGTKADVNPVHHLLGTAAGWGGLPAKEATYLVVNAGLPVGRYELHVGDDVPVDAFWSISVYNADGSSNRTRPARTASTASPAYATQTDRSPSDSVTTAPMRPTRSRSPRVGTMQSGSISHVPRSSTAPGSSRPSRAPDDDGKPQQGRRRLPVIERVGKHRWSNVSPWRRCGLVHVSGVRLARRPRSPHAYTRGGWGRGAPSVHVAPL